MNLGKLGVWAMTDAMTASEAAAFAMRVERWGYGALWVPEGLGRDPLVHAAWLLANTSTLVIASGVANIYARDGQTMAAAQQALNEQSNNRFLLGIGVSHLQLVEGLRGHRYGKPIDTMRSYLEAMSRATYQSPAPSERPLTVLAALGPKMLALARDRVDGAHPFSVSPQHTAAARAVLGPGKLLCPQQWLLLESDPIKARQIARELVGQSVQTPNYRQNYLRLGFGEAELAKGGSDRLVDAIVGWGDETAIRARVQAHWDAGADHVCIQAIDPKQLTKMLPDEHLLAALAPRNSWPEQGSAPNSG
jgi:probable F420-dependent oxidoreductase